MDETLVVCPQHEVETIACRWCGASFEPRSRKHVYCKPLCRLNAHREPHRARRARWTAARTRYHSMAFDGRSNGRTVSAGPLWAFEKLAHLPTPGEESQPDCPDSRLAAYEKVGCAWRRKAEAVND
jgi:hypothetical protein